MLSYRHCWFVVAGCCVVGGIILACPEKGPRIHVLEDGRETQTIRGATPLCDTNELIHSTCNDRTNSCKNLSQTNCTNNPPPCVACSEGALSFSLCDKLTYPLAYLCQPNELAGGCGVYYQPDNCVWAMGGCYCATINTTTILCTRFQDGLRDDPCVTSE